MGDYLDFLKQVRSTIWLDVVPFLIPRRYLQNHFFYPFRFKPVKLGFLDDDFELNMMSIDLKERRVLKADLIRIRTKPEAKQDDGYVLKFYFTMNDFLEEPTQIAYMKSDEDEVSALYKIPQAIFDNLSSMNKSHIIVVVQILELKSLDEKCPGKKCMEDFIEYVKRNLSPENIGYLGRILKNPELKDVFTGRMPTNYRKKVTDTIALLSKQFPKVVKYLEARYDNKEPDSDLDLGRLLHWVSSMDGISPIPNEEAVQQYLQAHALGLDCYKILTRDYLAKILHEDLVVIDVIDVALIARDKDLFEKAAICFVNRIHEVTSSEKFQHLIRTKAWLARYIIRTTRIWLPHSSVAIPEWAQTALKAIEF